MAPSLSSLRKAPRPIRSSLVSLFGVVLLGGVILVGARSIRSGALPGLTVGSVDVGGLDGAELKAALRRAAKEEGARKVTVERTGPGEPTEESYNLAELGYSLDVERTAEEILERGRQASPLAALADHVRATFGGFEVEAVTPLDGDRLEDWLARAQKDLSDRASPGGLEVSGTEVVAVAPEPGLRVTKSELRRAALGLLRGVRRQPLEVTAERVEPATDMDDVEAVVADARKALKAPVTLTRGEQSLTIDPADLGGILGTEITTGSGTSLRLTVDPKGLKSLVEDPNRFSEEPIDASFEPSGDGVRIVPSKPGFRFSAKRAAKQLAKIALSNSRSAEMKGKAVQAEFTMKEAEALEITEQVSTFTTYHSCCEPRVANIHRIADIVDGAIVQPGETFSLNDFVGPRTLDKGFVAAPAIRDGEFVPEVGGGISQFATTFFNAIFFGGYDFLEYKAHSYYISRYPRGREATISTPSPDLEFLNDSDAGIFIDTSYTDTSITVTFYGSSEYEIEAIMGEPFNFRPPEEECRTNKALAKGETRTIQTGITGFDVVVKRVFDPSDRVEEFRTHYLSQPRIVERKRC